MVETASSIVQEFIRGLKSAVALEVSARASRWRADPWLLASLLGFCLLFPTAARMALDSGRTWDEQVQLEYGDRILAWYSTGFTDRRALDFHNLYLYGGVFDLPAQWFISKGWSPWGPYETRHVMTALVASLGVLATWLTARRIAGARAGFLAACVLALTPTWMGHGLFNPKDIPFGTAAAFVAYASTCVAMGPPVLSWGAAVRVGITLGIALGIRSGGMFLAAYPVLAAFARLAQDAIEHSKRGESFKTQQLFRKGAVVAGRLAAIVPLSWGLMLSAWPWAQLDPLRRPLEAAGIAAHFNWGGVMLFDGRMIGTGDIPRAYLPVWFRVTLPDIYALAITCGVVALVAALRAARPFGAKALATSILFLFVVIPFAAVILLRPIIYDAHRHFLFIMPASAALAGLSIDAVIANSSLPRALRSGVVVLSVALSGLTLHDMWRLHPYEYVYFNRLSGGLKRQGSRFETDYWGASYREGFEWVIHNVKPKGKKRVVLKACEGDPQLVYYREQWHVTKFVLPSKRMEPEIFLATRRVPCGDGKGELLHTVARDGVPLLYVRRAAHSVN